MTYSNPAGYAQFMGRWSARLAPQFIRFAGVVDGQRILDVGSGTGSLSRALLECGSAISVVGVEPVPDYVSYARAAVPDPRATFQLSAAETLPFADATFDAVLSLLVVQDLDDPGRAVREMARAVRVGGTVAACTWDFEQGLPMFSLLWRAAEQVAPEMVARRRAERRAFRPGIPELTAIWTGVGLAAVRSAQLDLLQEFRSFDDYWRPFLAGATAMSQFVLAVNRETGGALAETLRGLIPDIRSDGSFTLTARALAVAGTADVR